MPTPGIPPNSAPRPPGGGPVEVALGFLAVSTRELIKLPFTVLRFQVHTVHRTLLAADAFRRSVESLAGMGIGVVAALRTPAEAPTESANGHGAVGDATASGAYAPFAPDITEPAADDDDEDSAAGFATPPDATPPDTASPDLEVRAAEVTADPVTADPVTADPVTAVPVTALPVTADGAPAFEVNGQDDADAADTDRVDIVTRAAEAAEAASHDPDLPVVSRDELPIIDFDHVTAGSLRGRLRRLDVAELRVLRMYEQEHARRLPILTLLENRIAKLEVDDGG